MYFFFPKARNSFQKLHNHKEKKYIKQVIDYQLDKLPCVGDEYKNSVLSDFFCFYNYC